jgi:hypothetical protein
MHYSVDQVKRKEMGGVGGTMEEGRDAYRVLVGIPE